MLAIGQLVRGGGQPARLEIGGRGAEDARAIGEFAHPQRAIFRQAKEKGHVEPFGGQVELAVRKPQAQVDLGVFLFESRDMRRDEPAPDAKGGCDMERAARRLGDGAYRRLGLVDRVENLAGAAVEDLALFGGVQLAGGAHEEADAEIVLKLGNPR